ncbi:hypothetical protein Gotri_008441 [Gossypium trilobum]|uniref:Cytochrome P450 n=1 Tax=Gossypium trilobum TaxID=34281 RepID=A0A7J9EJE3_9ROSI|nr:hypothetical protein [Gossypium trilobum]
MRTKSLSSKRVQSYRGVREEETALTMEKIEKCSSLCSPENLSELFSATTNKVTCKIALGRKYSEDTNKFRKLLSEFTKLFGAPDVGITLSSRAMTLSKELGVIINAWAIGRGPASWENPEEFLPDRFLDNSIDFKGQHFELIPFSSRRRICPGILFTIAINELLLANLVHKFDFGHCLVEQKRRIWT